MKRKLTIALVAILSSHAFAAIPSELPKLMNQQELAGFRDKLAQQYSKKAEKAPSEPSAFYTGKPYLASTDTYAFKYRNYNPALARWTSEDPSGFPDGANNSYYAPTPTSEFDWMGLARVAIIQKNYFDTISNYISFEQLRMDVGMDLTLVLHMRTAAFQEFKNSIAQAYSIGDEITKGPLISVLTKAINDDDVLLEGYPISRITSIEYADTSSYPRDTGFTFNAYIKSIKEYQYGPAE